MVLWTDKSGGINTTWGESSFWHCVNFKVFWESRVRKQGRNRENKGRESDKNREKRREWQELRKRVTWSRSEVTLKRQFSISRFSSFRSLVHSFLCNSSPLFAIPFLFHSTNSKVDSEKIQLNVFYSTCSSAFRLAVIVTLFSHPFPFFLLSLSDFASIRLSSFKILNVLNSLLFSTTSDLHS